MISFIIPFRSDGTREREYSFAFLTDWLEYEFDGEEIIIADQPGEVFSRAGSRNTGAEIATGDTLVFMDADSWVSAEQLWEGINVCGRTTHACWDFPYNVYYSLSRSGTEEFFDGDLNCDYEYVFPGADPVDRPPSVGGCVVVSRHAFDTVHGYDETFFGWGFEDRAFALSLETLCGPVIRVPGPLYHLWHPAPEEERFSQAHIEGNRVVYVAYQEAAGNPEMMCALVAQH